MSNIKNMPVSDEMLAAYLDGFLDPKQSDYVEQAIENDPELQWIVNRWIEEQTGSFSPTEAGLATVAASAAKPRPRRQIWAVAASILILITVLIPVLFNLENINPESGLPMGFPASERFESEYSDLTRHPIDTSSEENNSDNSKPFEYNYEIYKTAIIISWAQPLKSANCIAYSNDRNHKFTSSFQGSEIDKHRFFIVSLESFRQNEFPITIKLHFEGQDFVYSDSITINK